MCGIGSQCRGSRAGMSFEVEKPVQPYATFINEMCQYRYSLSFAMWEPANSAFPLFHMLGSLLLVACSWCSSFFCLLSQGEVNPAFGVLFI